MSDGSPGERYRLLYREGRAVIEAQNRTMAEIDDKAIRIVRLNAVIIGLIVAVIQIDPRVFNVWIVSVGALLLVLSSLTGIETVDESNLFAGVRGDYLRDLNHGLIDSTAWGADLIDTLSGMIAANEETIRLSARWLKATNGLLIGGIVVVFAAVPL